MKMKKIRYLYPWEECAEKISTKLWYDGKRTRLEGNLWLKVDNDEKYSDILLQDYEIISYDTIIDGIKNETD